MVASAPALRVMHVITPSRMAGAETALARLLRHSTDEHAVQHCLSSRNPAEAEMRAAGIPCQALGIGGKANPLAISRIRRAAHDFGAQLLHSHLSTASWWCGWWECLGGLPSIGHVHGFTSPLWHRRQTHLVACSHAVKSDLIEKGIPESRISVAHSPVDPDDMRPARDPRAVREELGVPSDAPLVGTFAHLSVKKGYQELVEAAHLVLQHMPRAQFLCFGEGPLRAELLARADEPGIADRFRLMGFRRNVPDLMRAIDVMALPSHREPYGLVYLEAALAEKPVIACDAGGAPEIIQAGETGLLARPRDPRSLADALLELLDNRHASAAMGRLAREQALARFTWGNYLTVLRGVYDRVLQG